MKKVPPYYYLRDLAWWIYTTTLLKPNATNFLSDAPEWPMFFVLYVYLTLFVKLVLLNMLIGLMGASIAASKQDAVAKSRL